MSWKNSILGFSEPYNAEFLGIFILYTYEHLKFHVKLGTSFIWIFSVGKV